MNKLEIKQLLIQKELAKISHSTFNQPDDVCGNGRSCDQIIDIGDESQLNARVEVSEKLDVQTKIHEKNIEFLKKVSFAPTSIIGIGAIIETNNMFLIVAIATKPFEYDHKQYVGISINAPLYTYLKEKTVGDECVFNDTKFVIKNIY
ncbi:hypothetical protein [Tenacibaculum amylolyticum]|uniref:hypothetical protein n=1 Tax=Tenacibaculum amylolyticum TaxID=104269 RepID=UPI0038963EDB